MRIRWRLPLAFALTTLVFAGIVALVLAVVVRDVLLDRLQDDMVRQARSYAAVLDPAVGAQVTGLEGGDAAALQELTRSSGSAAGVRFTIIDSEGTVLADSEVDPTTLENHRDRPEVAQALAGNEGRVRRESATLGVEEVYVAIPLASSEAPWSEGVVRVAQPANHIDEMVAAAWRVPLIVWVVLLAPTLAVAYFLTRSLTKPLERLRQMTARVAAGDFAYRTSVRSNDELGELAGSLNSMAEQLEDRAKELRAESQRSEEVLAAMGEGVILIDGDGRLLRANPAAERILGSRLQGLEGSPLVIAARSFPAQTLTQKARTAGHSISEVLETPGQRSLTVEVVPLFQPFGASSGDVLFVMRDETERRTTDRMRRDFATNVSHELKTPLAGLSLLAETLGDTIREDPVQARAFVARLSAEIGRLTDLTNDLLTLSRLEEPDSLVGATRVPVRLGPLAANVFEEIRPGAESKHHTLDISVAEDLVVNGDEVSLRTMLRNLLENAVRYTEAGGHISLNIEVETEQTGGRWALIKVTDDGVGIPLADQQRIFERFYRVDKARSRETGGTGLGLSIVKHVAERHGGHVQVKSTLGVGSTFSVRLPTA